MKNMFLGEETIDIRSENGVITAFIREDRECILSFPLSGAAAHDLRERYPIGGFETRRTTRWRP